MKGGRKIPSGGYAHAPVAWTARVYPASDQLNYRSPWVIVVSQALYDAITKPRPRRKVT
jgi:hypothetical protein